MSILNPGGLTVLDYDRLADAYLQSLPPEHFMEAPPQGTQREITLESFALLKVRRPDMQYFNELLVQYPYQGGIGQVVPDNMVILSPESIQGSLTYAVELEPTHPFLVLEYVSAASQRKDYEVSFTKYEQELKVPYCIMFYPEKQDLRVFHHDGTQYIRMEPDGQGRCYIAELDLHVGLLDGWLRFWYGGELLDLPADLAARINALKRKNRAQAARLAAQTKQLSEKDKQLSVQEQQLSVQEQQLSEKTETIDRMLQQIAIKQQQQEQWADTLRTHLERRAHEAGRDDILEQLAEADPNQLSRWISELG